jgi:hypothetical protein
MVAQEADDLGDFRSRHGEADRAESRVVECQKGSVDLGRLNVPTRAEDSVDLLSSEIWRRLPLDHFVPCRAKEPDQSGDLIEAKVKLTRRLTFRHELDGHSLSIISDLNSDLDFRHRPGSFPHPRLQRVSGSPRGSRRLAGLGCSRRPTSPRHENYHDHEESRAFFDDGWTLLFRGSLTGGQEGLDFSPAPLAKLMSPPARSSRRSPIRRGGIQETNRRTLLVSENPRSQNAAENGRGIEVRAVGPDIGMH